MACGGVGLTAQCCMVKRAVCAVTQTRKQQQHPLPVSPPISSLGVAAAVADGVARAGTRRQVRIVGGSAGLLCVRGAAASLGLGALLGRGWGWCVCGRVMFAGCKSERIQRLERAQNAQRAQHTLHKHTKRNAPRSSNGMASSSVSTAAFDWPPSSFTSLAALFKSIIWVARAAAAAVVCEERKNEEAACVCKQKCVYDDVALMMYLIIIIIIVCERWC